MLLLRLLVVAAAAQHAAATPAQYGASSFTASKAYTCAEAKEHDEIIFDCGGEFISKARPPPPHPAAPRRTPPHAAAATAAAAAAAATARARCPRTAIPLPGFSMSQCPYAGLLCVVRHAHRPLRRGQHRRLSLHLKVPCDEVGGLARAPRTSRLAPRASHPHARASRLNAARARRTMHATRRTPRPHGARRMPHASPRLASRQIVLEERCLGQTTCMFVVNDDLFGGDPCVGKQKRYAGYHP